jgi:cytidylate kinase
MSHEVFHIAIDGPLAAGKGTVARLVAQRLHLLYVDTGAMYRMTALIAMEKGIDLTQEEAILSALALVKMEMRNPTESEKDGRLTTVLVDGKDVSWEIRTPQVSSNASKVATLKKVRQFLVAKQQQIAQNQDVVMEGRDITFKVLPNADLKIYLTASDTTRAKRRQMELQAKGNDVTFEQVYADLIERDKRDMERSVDPLQIVDDAWVVDTTELTIDDAVELIVQRAQEMRAKK